MVGTSIEDKDNLDEPDKIFTNNLDIRTESTTKETSSSEENGSSKSDISIDQSINSNVSDKEIKIKEDREKESDSKFFAIRTTGSQEDIVVTLAQNRINLKKIPVRSIVLLDSFKGYIIIEAPDSNIAYDALIGIRHVKGQIRGELPYKDIENYLVKRPVVSELNIDDTVEIVAGPFKSMKAKITRVDYEKQEATVLLLDSPYQIPVTVDANYLKKI